ncbi:hypothetical protein T03_793 [Trichinella britovi]|uniref:Uncharacterized protein n=1 Tax=Trichinella britovi TaxID=45882 RepID=A0A0V0YYL0_TRIBR|nr:hypothetical protein T03_793 [Trichinella britovi]
MSCFLKIFGHRHQRRNQHTLPALGDVRSGSVKD